MLKETEETIVFFVTFLSLVAFQLGGRAPGYAYVRESTIVLGGLRGLQPSLAKPLRKFTY